VKRIPSGSTQRRGGGKKKHRYFKKLRGSAKEGGKKNPLWMRGVVGKKKVRHLSNPGKEERHSNLDYLRMELGKEAIWEG